MTATAENGWQLSVTRHIPAPPAKVWQIMTEHITEYWCPKPWTSEFTHLEWRAGGRKSGMMRGPNPGEEVPMEGIFLEVTPQHRFVFTNAVNVADGNWMPDAPFMIGGFEIAAENGGTRYTAWSRHWDEDTCKKHAEMGFYDGWNAVADQLATICEAA
jgi:uncharacterized protein YndB with AHSA1/START domain